MTFHCGVIHRLPTVRNARPLLCAGRPGDFRHPQHQSRTGEMSPLRCRPEKKFTDSTHDTRLESEQGEGNYRKVPGEVLASHQALLLSMAGGEPEYDDATNCRLRVGSEKIILQAVLVLYGAGRLEKRNYPAGSRRPRMQRRYDGR